MASPLDAARELVRRSWARVRQRRARPGFHSRFGGLWTDKKDAAQLLEQRRGRGEIGDEDAARLAGWMQQGFWIEKGAVPEATIARLESALAALAADATRPPLVEIGGRYERLSSALAREHVKLVDAYALSAAVLEAAFAEPIRRFLRLVLEDDALLFQSLSFERGSEQPAHQDTAYVVVSPPLAFVAAWIALEDVRAGSGELVYYPGSHRLPDHRFGNGGKNWNRERDGVAAQDHYHAELLARCAARGLAPSTFLPQRGDVLFWSADLAHGGTPIVDRRLSRRSLVCHYCPANAVPYYFHHQPRNRTVLDFAPGCRYASSHYELSGR
jgi:ectoine hydroxylase-related dioxygenase (phytanoyl-CoA dioxygenase family)